MMLNQKIDYAKFMRWFLVNYPASVSILKNNLEYQYRFNEYSTCLLGIILLCCFNKNYF